MAYNKRNLLNKILKVQAIVLRESARGIFLKKIFELHIEKQFDISYSTFNNYLSCNAKRELDKLNKEEAERKKQLTLIF